MSFSIKTERKTEKCIFKTIKIGDCFCTEGGMVFRKLSTRNAVNLNTTHEDCLVSFFYEEVVLKADVTMNVIVYK